MFCSKCGAENPDSAQFCQKCGASLAAPPQYSPPAAPGAPAADPRMRAGAPPVAPVEKRYATGRNPILALILSAVIVGVGQFYNGDNKKGLVMLACAVVFGVLTLGIAWFGIAVWSAIDAYMVASGKTALW